MPNSFIWPINRTLSSVTTVCQSRPGCNGNEGVLRTPQSSSIIVASPSDCLASKPSAEMQSVYSAPSTDWAAVIWNICIQRLLWKGVVSFDWSIFDIKVAVLGAFCQFLHYTSLLWWFLPGFKKFSRWIYLMALNFENQQQKSWMSFEFKHWPL